MSTIEPKDASAVGQGRPWRLVIAHRIWSEACRALLADRAVWATGDITWHPGPEARDFLCRSLTATSRAPRGRDPLALADWIVLRIVPLGERLTREKALASHVGRLAIREKRRMR